MPLALLKADSVIRAVSVKSLSQSVKDLIFLTILIQGLINQG